nr:alpha/beta hydrolase [Spelaeicoccus albus]
MTTTGPLDSGARAARATTHSDAEPQLARVSLSSNIRYGTASPNQSLTVCSPAASADSAAGNRPAVLEIHGGGWAHGDKSGAGWTDVCRWLATQGYVAFSLNYRLVPAARFPAQLDDVTAALRWIRTPKNAKRFAVDPHRLGVFGGSAGGNLAALLGMRGTGDLHSGTRVAAVVDLSGPIDLTAAGQRRGRPGAYLQRLELAYLHCRTFARCAQSKAASPLYAVDPSDPPVFIGGSENELVPSAQGKAFASALRAARVPHTLDLVPGHRHSIKAFDRRMRAKVAAFLNRWLG